MPERVLIVRMSAMGDVVQTTPVARGIRQVLPDCHLAWMAQRPFSTLLEHNPHIDELIVLPHRNLGIADLLDAWWKIKAGDFTIAVDAQGLLKSAVVTWASGAPWRIGQAEAREAAGFAYNELVRDRGDQIYVSQRYLDLCASLGVDRDDFVPEITLVDEDYAPVDELLLSAGVSGDEPLVAIAPCAAEARKEWPEASFVRVAEAVIDRFGARIIVPGSPGEVERAERFAAQLGENVTVLAGRTNMRQVAALLSRCNLLIAGESGLTHIGYAVGTPLVCIVGPTPLRNGPTGPNARTVYAEGIDCRPCRRKNCPHSRCLHRVTPEMVIEAVEELAPVAGLDRQRA